MLNIPSERLYHLYLFYVYPCTSLSCNFHNCNQLNHKLKQFNEVPKFFFLKQNSCIHTLLSWNPSEVYHVQASCEYPPNPFLEWNVKIYSSAYEQYIFEDSRFNHVSLTIFSTKAEFCEEYRSTVFLIVCGTLWETHYVEYSVELVMVVRITSFYIFLSAVKYWLWSEQFGKYATYCPNIWNVQCYVFINAHRIDCKPSFIDTRQF